VDLRHRSPSLRRGDFTVLHATKNVVVYRRRYQGETAVVAVNAGREPASFTLKEGIGGALPDALDGDGKPLRPNQSHTLGPRAGRLWLARG
jgi:hypothetical protein